jgi:hypothetical protein
MSNLFSLQQLLLLSAALLLKMLVSSSKEQLVLLSSDGTKFDGQATSYSYIDNFCCYTAATAAGWRAAVIVKVSTDKRSYCWKTQLTLLPKLLLP